MGYFVYVHTCPNEKRYVGITRQELNKRWNNGWGYIDNIHFSRAINKYGWENIKHTVYEVETENEMYYLEKYLIAYYSSNDPKYGYNNSRGGESGGYGCKRKKESIIKTKNTILERYGTLVNSGCFSKDKEPWNKGKKGLQVAWNKGKKMTEEQKKKLSESHMGKVQTEETKKKRSESMKGKNSGNKPLYDYINLDNGEILHITASKARFIKNIQKINNF